jgi:hypothetical protein
MTLARVRALIVLGVLSLMAVVSVVWAIATDAQPSKRLADPCAQASASAAAIPPAKAVKVRVYNATDRNGLANIARTLLIRRGFTVIQVGNDPQRDVLTAGAQIRYGAKGIGAAQLLHAHVPYAELISDDRENPTVDLVLGPTSPSFGILAPAKKVPGNLKKLPPPPAVEEAAC